MSFLRDRFLGADEIALRFRRASELLRGSDAEIAAAITLAEQTLAYDPYNVAMHQELAMARARAGDADGLYAHLSICFDMEALDATTMRGSASLRGAVAADAFEEIVARVEKEHARRVRYYDVSFDEIAPNTNTFETRLVWPAEHQDAVVAAFRRLVGSAARSRASSGDGDVASALASLESYVTDVESPFTLGAYLIGVHGFFGKVHQFLRDAAPYVEDVRFLMFDQVSPVDELWIFRGVLHVRRHPLADCDLESRARFFEELTEREGEDPSLTPYLTMLWRDVAHIDLEADEHRREDSDGTGDRAEHAIRRLLALGDEPFWLQSRLHAFRGEQADATHHLEKTVEASPSFRDAIVLLAKSRLDEQRFEEALDLADRAIMLRPDYGDDMRLVRSVALGALGRHDEAKAAYLEDTEIRHDTAEADLRDADLLFANGRHASAEVAYERLLDAPFCIGLRAELGLARCAEVRGDPKDTRRHYERVLERALDRRATYAGSPGLIAEIDRAAARARAALMHCQG